MKQLSRLHKIVMAICVCLIIQLALSWKLWLPIHREFPLVSAFSFLNMHYGIIVDAVLFGLLILGLISLAVYPFNSRLIAVLAVVIILFVLEDIMRLQPWLYMFGLMLLAIASVKPDEGEERVLFIIRLILAGTYIWSGIQKMNHAFTVEIFPWIMGPFGLNSFLQQHHRLAYFVPLIELSAGVLLLFRRSQKPAGILLVIMHLVILFTLGPWANSWNKIVWPWNIAMVAILVVIISQKDYLGLYSSIGLLKKSKWAITLVILAGVMPVLNFAGAWDNYLSGSLYSGNIPEAIFFNEKDDNAEHSLLAQYPLTYYPQNGGEYYVIDALALNELGVPVYPEERYFKRIGQYLCAKVKNTKNAGIVIVHRKRISSEKYQEVCKCDSLLKNP